ncbi:glycosyltransferase family 4 protein [Sphingomonas lenta]|uniref:Glycosyl transferase family 1 n=1 Tax=Sphingomonas lenta TaxID=1141887 RepID=A0A2A2SJ23_9SPHN|nr:glycosyltransferase family 4 protein [Sphingomonas lenta]PAX09229.1 glycosyl transferase family 1 [Sphingomonas lenta]
MSDDLRRDLSGRTILMLPRYGELGPSSRLRMGQFAPRLEGAGATVRSSPFFDDDYLRALFGSGSKSKLSSLRAYARRTAALARERADLVWIERELFPFLPGGFERALRARRIPYVVDWDDAVFHRYDRHPCSAVRRVLGRKFDASLRGSAAATPGNSYLARYMAEHGARRVVTVPTVVDPRRYDPRPRARGASLRLGWIGTPANARYLSVVADAIRLLGDEAPVTLVTIGAPRLDGFPVEQEAHDWSEDSEARLLSTVDVGVMPLPDRSFERGKCGYKLIQYMASGRAVIASPVGVNAEIVDGEVGLLATTPAEWAEAIRMLAADPARTEAMGQAGRRRVEERYSIDVAGAALVDLFASVASEARR